MANLPQQLREGHAFALARGGGPFHVLREGTFPSESLCGLRLGALVDLPLQDVCGNCVTILSFETAAEDLNQRITNVHEFVVCPKCDMPVGIRCKRMGAHGAKPLTYDRDLKNPHRERIAAAGISLR